LVLAIRFSGEVIEALHFLAFGYVLSSFNIELQVKEE
jgi:hypothetical protein